MEYVLQTDNLTKCYKNIPALDGLTMHIPKGAIYGFVGRNGAGKTTLIRLICGLQEPSSGSFSLFGIRNDSKDIVNSRRKIGAIVETPAIYMDMTAEENLRQQYRILGISSYVSIPEILKLVGLENISEEESEAIEVVTPANYYCKNGKHYILYDEVTEGISGVTKNKIKISGEDSLEIMKSGISNAHMIFERNKKNEQCANDSGCLPNTPFRCANGVCVSDASKCPATVACDANKPYVCADKSCVADSKECKVLYPCGEGYTRCDNGYCAKDASQCEASGVLCPIASPIKCPTGKCVSDYTECSQSFIAPTCEDGEFYCVRQAKCVSSVQRLLGDFKKIELIEFNTKAETNIFEIYYISKLKPKFNSESNTSGLTNFGISSPPPLASLAAVLKYLSIAL